LSIDRLEGSAIENKLHWDGERFNDELTPVTDAQVTVIIAEFTRLVNLAEGRQHDADVRDLCRKYLYERMYIDMQQRVPFTVSPQTKAQRVRNRLWVAFTVSRNPQLAGMRKRAIYSKKRNELHQKYLAMMLHWRTRGCIFPEV
jgi:hypothetical protein